MSHKSRQTRMGLSRGSCFLLGTSLLPMVVATAAGLCPVFWPKSQTFGLPRAAPERKASPPQRRNATCILRRVLLPSPACAGQHARADARAYGFMGAKNDAPTKKTRSAPVFNYKLHRTRPVWVSSPRFLVVFERWFLHFLVLSEHSGETRRPVDEADSPAGSSRVLCGIFHRKTGHWPLCWLGLGDRLLNPGIRPRSW